MPLVNGLLTGAWSNPHAIRAFLGGVALGVCGGIAVAPPVMVLILVLPAPCAETNPPTCFGPAFTIAILGFLMAWIAGTLGFSSGVAAALGVLVTRLIDRLQTGA